MLEKEHSPLQWNTNPCGTGQFNKDIPENTAAHNTLEYYENIRRIRYDVAEAWMKKTIDFSCAKGKKLLEIGHGIGTDLLTFCENGAEVYGIDITEKHHKMAKENFRLHGKNAELQICDAANICYQDNFFDIVYSHGVLHHTPDTEECISEAFRVLKPGGTFILSMYHKYSAFHIWTKIIFDGILRMDLFRLGYRGLMSTLEYGADGINIKPLVKTYSKKQVRKLLFDFSNVDIIVRHFEKTHLPLLHIFTPKWLEKKLEPFIGWYVIAFAKK